MLSVVTLVAIDQVNVDLLWHDLNGYRPLAAMINARGTRRAKVKYWLAVCLNNYCLASLDGLIVLSIRPMM